MSYSFQKKTEGHWVPLPKKNSSQKKLLSSIIAKVSNPRQTKRPRNHQTKTQQQLIPSTRRRRKKPHPPFSANLEINPSFGKLTPKIKRPVFKVSLDPNSILGKLHEMKPKDFLPKIPKIKLNKPVRRLFNAGNSIFSCISSVSNFQFDNDQVIKYDIHIYLQPNFLTSLTYYFLKFSHLFSF